MVVALLQLLFMHVHNSCDDTDDDECEENNGGCSQICNNTLGSYRCLCYEGYSLDFDGFNCSGKKN